MTLTIHDDIEQGTEAWHDQRRGIITASAVGKLITPKTVKPASNPESRAFTMSLAAERITGWTEPTYINMDMQRGIDDEPIARNIYASHQTDGLVAETGFMVEDRWGFKIGYSPDGLVGDDGLIEIKSRRAKTQLATILADEPPLENMAQLQTGLLVSGRNWIDYVSYCAGMPLYVKRVQPDERWFNTIIETVERVETDIADIIHEYDTAIDLKGFHPTQRPIELVIGV